MVATLRPPLALLCVILFCGCASGPRGQPAPDLAERLPALRDRLEEIRGERLEELPRVERWTLAAFRRYLLERWEDEWPRELAEEEERILVALELWPRDLDYRDETLRVSVEETNAAYLEDLDTIAVLTSGAVTDRTLIHELTHALQQERWGDLPSVRTFEEQYQQTASLEREAVLVEEALDPGHTPPPATTSDPSALPRVAAPRPPAHAWLLDEPGRLGPRLLPRHGYAKGFDHSRWAWPVHESWQGLPLEAPRFRSRDQGQLGEVGREHQVLGVRGVAHWAAPLLGPVWRAKGPRASHWYLDDRLRVEGDRIVWRIHCLMKVAQELQGLLATTRPKVSARVEVLPLGIPLGLETQADIDRRQGILELRIPLPTEPGR